MIYINTFYIFILGLCLGSFINVLVLRNHKNIPWWKGYSYCPKCKKKLQWYELIPLVSFIIQRGKCKNCNKPISYQYPIVELLTGILFALVFYNFGLDISSILLLTISFFLIASFVSDFKYMELPDLFTLPANALALVLFLYNQDFAVTSLLIGAVFGFMFFASQYLITKGQGVGDGDMRLGLLMGILFGWPYILIPLGGAYITGTLYALILLIQGKPIHNTRVPLGVLLIPWIFIMIFYSAVLTEWFDHYFRVWGY